MLRVLFKIGDFPIYSYGVMLVIGFIVAIAYARRRAPRFGIKPDSISDMALVAVIAGILGARLGYIVQDLPHFLSHPKELFAWRFDGLTSFGGLIVGALAIIVWTRIAKVGTVRLLDAIAPAYLAAYAIGRVGCLLNGCCHGGQCDLPWGVTQLGDNNVLLPGHYHPAQIYEALMNVAAIFVLVLLERRKLRFGQATAIVLVLHGVARFIYEFWRAGSTSAYMGNLPITEAQVVAIGIVIVGMIVAYLMRNNGRVEAS